MAARLGATFLVGALGPVNFAGGLILGSQVPDGLRELAPDNLFGGLSRGIDFAAKRVGVSPSDVERLLPMGELRVVIQRPFLRTPAFLDGPFSRVSIKRHAPITIGCHG